MESKFGLSLREVMTFWELIFLQQDTGNDSSRDLHPSLTTYLEVMFRNEGIIHYRPWILRNWFQYRQKDDKNEMKAGAKAIVKFLRECAEVLEAELDG